jgi:hypothetical protein
MISAQTTVSHAWIAERLCMRSTGNVAQQFHRLRIQNAAREARKPRPKRGE